MANPNWVDVTKLKSKLYADISVNTYDDLLSDLGQEITDRMLSFMNSPAWIDPTTPSPELQRAALMQANYEWRRRNDPGLSSVTFHDGNVNKYTTEEFLPEVKAVLERNRSFQLFPTT
jgi:hypothetical protein